MASRMEKYYKVRDAKRRSVKNESLYQTIYEDETYSNIEGVVATPKANEIDIEKIREMLASHEISKNNRRKINREPINIEPEIEEPLEEKNYDIRDILVKAKDSRETTENKEDKYRSLQNTEYNILKNIKINNKQDIEDEDELKELINTITNTSLLNKLSDKELSLNLLDDLKANTIYEESPSIKALIQESKEEQLNKTGEMDTSFFTSSLGFSDKDFDKLQDISNSINKNNKIMKIILVVIFIALALVLGFIIYSTLK